ncbi:MAG: YkgJ family cysteine cluster protein [Salinivirgaceae bacterium]|nr:YkgJ family cysteine cluster protein [Salinivirgaceae bacterium]
MDDIFLGSYYNLRDELDKACEKFTSMHISQLECKKGCDSCCESLNIFPIEFYALQEELVGKNLPKFKWSQKFGKSCRFLKNGECQIYNSRPIICRTQGLPLLYENKTGTGYELSVCKLNFKGVKVDTFTMDNALFMPPMNSKLFLLNQAFVSKFTHKKIDHFKRFKLNTLLK